MNTIPLRHPKGTRRIEAASGMVDGLDTHPNSEVPSIVPHGIQDRHTETISLTEQLLDEWNHRLKNNLQILVGLLQSGYSKARNPEAREVLSDAIRRIGALGTAQSAYYYYCARGSTDVNGQELVNAVCANARILLGSDVLIDCKMARGNLPKEAAMPLALIINELLMNAAKYGGDQHGQVTITVGLSRRPGLYELCVQDEGFGFDLENPGSRSSGPRIGQGARATPGWELQSGANSGSALHGAIPRPVICARVKMTRVNSLAIGTRPPLWPPSGPSTRGRGCPPQEPAPGLIGGRARR